MNLKGGGVYKILTKTGIVRTKHTRFIENTFTGPSGILPDEKNDVEDESSVAFPLEDEDPEGQKQIDANDEERAGLDGNQFQLALTYVTPKPSLYGETDEGSEVIETEEVNPNMANEEPDSSNPTRSLRPLARVDYSMKGGPEFITTLDEPTMEKKLGRPEKAD